jgi:hypothetical protein
LAAELCNCDKGKKKTTFSPRLARSQKLFAPDSWRLAALSVPQAPRIFLLSPWRYGSVQLHSPPTTCLHGVVVHENISHRLAHPSQKKFPVGDEEPSYLRDFLRPRLLPHVCKSCTEFVPWFQGACGVIPPSKVRPPPLLQADLPLFSLACDRYSQLSFFFCHATRSSAGQIGRCKDRGTTWCGVMRLVFLQCACTVLCTVAQRCFSSFFFFFRFSLLGDFLALDLLTLVPERHPRTLARQERCALLFVSHKQLSLPCLLDNLSPSASLLVVYQRAHNKCQRRWVRVCTTQC